MQTAQKIQTRREFVSGLRPAWLRWAKMKALVYAAAVLGLVWIGSAIIRNFGITGSAKTAGVFLALFALAYAGDRISAFSRGILNRSPKVPQASICAFGRLLGYTIFGLCCIYLYEQ